MDVSKDSIAVAVLDPDRDRAPVEKIFHDEASVRRLIGRFEDRSRVWACYEAGPTGYDLYRLLTGLGVRCDVIAPSLIPKRRGDHVKTDKRDARLLAGLHRAGQLTPIGVP
jgi:transposase